MSRRLELRDGEKIDLQVGERGLQSTEDAAVESSSVKTPTRNYVGLIYPWKWQEQLDLNQGGWNLIWIQAARAPALSVVPQNKEARK